MNRRCLSATVRRPGIPDLVLQTRRQGHKLAGVVEVETAESVNHLEAMSQWATFARLRVPFHLYLPTGSRRQRPPILHRPE